MNPNKKQILKNPIDLYSSMNNPCCIKNKEKIEILSNEYNNVLEKIKQQKEISQKTSRLIGAAKKEGLPIEQYLLEMQCISKLTKSLKSQLKTLESHLLSFFETETNQSTDNKIENTNSSFTKNTRDYHLEKINLKSIAIKQLDKNSTEWDQYVKQNIAASIYHLSQWKKLINDTFGHASVYLYATNENNKIVGILPITHLKSKLFGSFMVSVPYFNYGGAVADHPEIEKRLLEAAAIHAKKENISNIEYRDDILREGLPVKTEKINMILTLPSSKKQLWDSFTPKLRAQIKRPQQENTSTMIGKENCLDEFYQVFSRNMRDLGTPVYSKLFFKNILYSFPNNATIIIIRLNNKPVSAAFLLGYKDKLEIPWASTIKETNHLSMNMLLYWEVLQFAISRKFKAFDFGRSSKDAGTYKFKKQWGAQGKNSYWHYWLNEGVEMPSLNPNNPKYKLVIAIWKKLPIFITKIIGPGIVKNLP